MRTIVLAAAVLFVLVATTAAQSQDTPISEASLSQRRSQIRQALFVPDPLPPLETQHHGSFEPAAGVVAHRLLYQTQFGLRVPAILYLPKDRAGQLPGIIIVNGHGGDKYSWYAFYSGVLYARAGAAVLTYDPIGEGERNIERKSGTRAHDKLLDPPEMGRRLGGLMVTDLLQALSLLQSRPEVDRDRIAAAGYSMGSFVLAIAGAVDERLHACILTGGGNLDGPGGYWDGSKPMCQALPYKALEFLGDRPAAIYAVHAARGPTLIINGAADTVVAIPTHGEPFFADLRKRTLALHGSKEGVFEYRLIPDVSHRPFVVTRDVAQWLEENLDLPNWTSRDIAAMPTTHISRWAAVHDVAMDRGYLAEDREGGTQALGEGVPALSRDQLSVFDSDVWETRKNDLTYEAWVTKAQAALKENAAVTQSQRFVARDYSRKTIYHSPQTPGYTCWVGTWTMPDGSLMVTFKQATGPLEGRPRDIALLQKMNLEVLDPRRDFTGLELANVYLRSTNGGKTWMKMAEEKFPGPFDRAAWGGSHVALADGSILRAIDGSQLPTVPGLPRRIYFERSNDLGQTWERLTVPPQPRRPNDEFLGDFGDCISRVKRLKDGQLLATGVVRPDASRRGAGQPLVMLSADEGRSWQPQEIQLPPAAEQLWAWNEWDSAERPSGELLCVFRRRDPSDRQKQVRWQGILKRGQRWSLEDYKPAPFDHSGHPELLATREGLILHIATSGVHWTSDGGATWRTLEFPDSKAPYRSRYYPRSVQLADGTICVVSHVGADNAYGQADQAIVLDRFRLTPQEQ